MKPWQDDLLSRMQAALCQEELFRVVRDEALMLGFDQCAYGLRLSVHVTKPKVVLVNNYPLSWQQCYAQHNYLAIDPTVHHCGRSVMPLIWEEHIFKDTRDFWEDARSHGLCHGWAQSCANLQGTQGMLTLARSAEPLSGAEMEKNGYKMVWLTQAVHQCMSSLILAGTLSQTVFQLSKREKDVLRWTADGKTAGEISDIMNITERTVNFHISKAMEKLGCVNKTAATVRAALLGLLS